MNESQFSTDTFLILFFAIAKLMILLCRFVVQCVRKETKKEEGNNDSNVDSQSEEEDKVCCRNFVESCHVLIFNIVVGIKLFHTDVFLQENEDDESGISAKDTALMVGILEAIIVLWEGSGKIFKVLYAKIFLRFAVIITVSGN